WRRRGIGWPTRPATLVGVLDVLLGVVLPIREAQPNLRHVHQYYPSLRVVHDARKLQAFRCVASIILRATHLGGRPPGTRDVRQPRDVTCGSDMSAMPLGGGTTLWDTMSLNCAPIEASRVGMFAPRLKGAENNRQMLGIRRRRHARRSQPRCCVRARSCRS